jgi:hypothetical protein
MCENAVCVSDPCPGAIALGTQNVPGDDGGSGSPSLQSVTGQATVALETGATTPFDYATSVWPKPYGWQLDGWFLQATQGESLTFKMWADQDAGGVPLGLVVYGPLAGVGTETCEGSLEAGPMTAAAITWAAPAEGWYFVAPYHTVVETPQGLAYQDLNDTDFARAFFVVESSAISN